MAKWCRLATSPYSCGELFFSPFLLLPPPPPPFSSSSHHPPYRPQVGFPNLTWYIPRLAWYTLLAQKGDEYHDHGGCINQLDCPRGAGECGGGCYCDVGSCCIDGSCVMNDGTCSGGRSQESSLMWVEDSYHYNQFCPDGSVHAIQYDDTGRYVGGRPGP